MAFTSPFASDSSNQQVRSPARGNGLDESATPHGPAAESVALVRIVVSRAVPPFVPVAVAVGSASGPSVARAATDDISAR
jgi:hypothetical protein